MDELADQYTATVAALKLRARQLLIRNPAKLLQAARDIPGANSRLAKLALEDSVSKQVLAPAYKSTGKSAATAPNEILQADLFDYSQNTRTKERYALFLQDIYTREVRTVPLLNKKSETVNSALRSAIPSLVGDNTNYAITTDSGKEFSNMEAAIPASAVHRSK